MDKAMHFIPFGYSFTVVLRIKLNIAMLSFSVYDVKTWVNRQELFFYFFILLLMSSKLWKACIRDWQDTIIISLNSIINLWLDNSLQ